MRTDTAQRADTEPVSVAAMNEYLKQTGYVEDISDARRHHEIYLTDARKTAPEKWKTVIRHPVRKEKGKNVNI